MTAAFILYVGIIPLVPLMGVRIYKKRGDRTRKNVCLGLFVLQCLLGALYIISWLRTRV